MKHSSCRSVTISGLSIAFVADDITSGYRTVTDIVAIIGVVDVYVDIAYSISQFPHCVSITVLRPEAIELNLFCTTILNILNKDQSRQWENFDNFKMYFSAEDKHEVISYDSVLI